MRTRAAGPLLVCTCLSLVALHAADGPQVAYVTSDKTIVRSGPGERFYTTGELLWGTEVEVFAARKDGWLAIRPPEGSFSWVDGRQLQPTTRVDVAEVVDGPTPARIGSELSQHWEAVQIRLEPGDQVEVLGTEQIAGQTWYMIQPPAGEFRWIRQLDIGRRPPRFDAMVNDPDSNSVAGTHPVEEDQLGDATVSQTQVDPSGRRDSGYVDQVAWTPRRPRTNDQHVSAEPRQPLTRVGRLPKWNAERSSHESTKFKPTDRASVGAAHPGRPQRDMGLAATRPPEEPTGDDAFDAEQIAIEVELSRMVSQSPATWQLEPVRQRVRRLISQGRTTRERGVARLMLERIAEFEDVRLRHEQMSGGPEGALVMGTVGPIGSGVPARLTAETNRSGVPYDGSGWLMPVVTRRPDVPRFALTDDYGKILQFVTPVPGLNLQRYLRQQIGITGKRDGQTKFDRPHLTAQRVVVLDRHRR